MEKRMFEYLVLKSLVHDGEFFNKCFNLLKSDYFKEFGNKELFKLLKEYYSEYKERPQEIALAALIKNVVNVETRKTIIESLKKLNSLELNKNTQFMCNETIKFIKDVIYYKALEIGSEGLMNKDESKMKKAQGMFEEMSKIQIDSNLGLDFDNIQEQIDYYSKREVGIRTQHKSFNKRLGSGFLPGTLNVILAAQGVGKSLLMCDFISGMLLKNKNILMVSLEMSPNEMLKRIQANVFNIDANSFCDLSKTDGEIQNLERPCTTKEKILDAYNKVKLSGSCGKLFIKEYPAGSFSSLMLQDLVEKFKVEKDIKFDIIFIDYLGIMKSDLVSPNVGLYSYIKSIGEEVRAFAVKNSIAVISASQLNRASVNKTDGVDNSMIADSIGTAATADFMVFLLQTEEMKQKSEMLCKITKNRYTGITDSFVMNIDYPKMKFSDIDQNKDLPENALVDFKTVEQKEKAESFAKKEISEINKNSFNAIKKADNSQKDVDILDILGL
jgi:replicative DNA helicase